MTTDPSELARRVRILEAQLRRSEQNRARLEEQRDCDNALYRQVIGQMQETERRLRDSEQVAQAASLAKSEFLANMSHEIRTPLTGIIGITELLHGTSLDPRQAAMLGNLATAAGALAQLIDDVLDFSRIEAGRLQLELGDFDPAAPLREAVDMITDRAARKGLTVVCEPPPPSLVHGDAFRLRQVLVNLLGNALKFTSEGHIHVRAEIVGDANAAELLVTVADTGIGVRADQAELIFEAFRQADGSTTRRYGGSGLGLAISRELMRAMAGTLTAAPREGGGSVFTLRLPHARLRTELAPSPPAELRVEPRALPDVAGCRILVAEDNPVNRDVVASILVRAGASVTLAADGLEAIHALAAEPFDLAFVDLHMPGYDGLAVAAFARRNLVPEGPWPSPPRSRNRGTPIVALTASVLHADRERCREAGMDDFVAKPFTRVSLASALTRWCRPRLASALDAAVLAELREFVDDAALARMIGKFAVVAEQGLGALEHACTTASPAAVFDAAHPLKSSAGQLGAAALSSMLAQLEARARGGGLPSAAELVALGQAFDDAIAMLQRALGEPPAMTPGANG
ncbi:MAG: response regulator [Nannocystaceae bacterium]|nr:response regulator [Nannocystaceae bacterium]